MSAMRSVTAAVLGAAALALTAGSVFAAAASTASAPVGPKVLARKKPASNAATAPKATVDPAALAAMSKMATYLHGLKAFEVVTHTERDEVDDFGQIITLGGETTYKVRAPDAFVISNVEDRKARDYIYDGKTVTIFAPRMGYYAKFDAPSSIRETLDLAEQKYGVSVPLDDLFAWDRGNVDHSNITSAHVVGPAKIDGEDTLQYAFRQKGVDWQIWIANGDKPLPRKVVIVASDDPARPQFEADLKWNTAPDFSATTFTFSPPTGARQIAIQSQDR